MCVYCTDAPACDHERDSCAAIRGVYCAECQARLFGPPVEPACVCGPANAV